MKKSLSLIVVIALAAAMLPAAFAQQNPASPSASPSAPAASQQPDQNSQPGAAAQGSTPPQASQNSSFTGTVVNANGKYVLKTDSGTYQLDDQDKAKQFEGKQVKVTGSLDSATSVLHVTDISPVSAQ